MPQRMTKGSREVALLKEGARNMQKMDMKLLRNASFREDTNKEKRRARQNTSSSKERRIETSKSKSPAEKARIRMMSAKRVKRHREKKRKEGIKKRLATKSDEWSMGQERGDCIKS